MDKITKKFRKFEIQVMPLAIAKKRKYRKTIKEVITIGE